MKPQAPVALFGLYDAYAFQSALHSVKRYAERATPYSFIASHSDYPNGKRFTTQSAAGDHWLKREVIIILIWGGDLRGMRREEALVVVNWLINLIQGLIKQRQTSDIEEGNVNFFREDWPENPVGILDFRIKEWALEKAVAKETREMRNGRS